MESKQSGNEPHNMSSVHQKKNPDHKYNVSISQNLHLFSKKNILGGLMSKMCGGMCLFIQYPY